MLILIKVIVSALLLLLVYPAYAQQTAYCKKGAICGLEWDANTEPDMHSYRLYHKPIEAQEYNKLLYLEVLHPTRNITEVVTPLNIPDGSFSFVLTALDKSGNESEYSEEVIMHIDRNPPSRPIIRLVIPTN